MELQLESHPEILLQQPHVLQTDLAAVYVETARQWVSRNVWCSL